VKKGGTKVFEAFIASLMSLSFCHADARATGCNSVGCSHHAEARLLRVLRRKRQNVFRTRGKGVIILIVSVPGNGGSAVPCQKCRTMLLKLLPLAKVMSYHHGVAELARPTLVTKLPQRGHTRGTRTPKR